MEFRGHAGDADDHAGATPVERLERVAGDVGKCDTVERPVDTARVERSARALVAERLERDDRVDDVVARAVEEIRGAELLRERLLVGRDVDGDDAASPFHLERLDHVETHAADTEHRRRLAELHVGAVEDRAHAGDHPTPHQRRRCERYVVGDRHHLHVAHHGAVGEHGRGGEVAHALALEREDLARVPEGLPARCGTPVVALLAEAARGQRCDDHVVAGLHVGDGLPHLGHDARTLVAAHRGNRPGIEAGHE